MRLGTMTDDEIAAVRPFERAARAPVAFATGREALQIGVLDIDGGGVDETPLRGRLQARSSPTETASPVRARARGIWSRPRRR